MCGALVDKRTLISAPGSLLVPKCSMKNLIIHWNTTGSIYWKNVCYTLLKIKVFIGINGSKKNF